MIPQSYRDNFTTLHQAFDAGDACLLECHEQATGKPVYVICAVNRCGEHFELVPSPSSLTATLMSSFRLLEKPENQQQSQQPGRPPRPHVTRKESQHERSIVPAA